MGCSVPLSEVERSKSRSRRWHGFDRMSSDFVTLCLKCAEGSIKEEAKVSEGQRHVRGHIPLLVFALWPDGFFHTAEKHIDREQQDAVMTLESARTKDFQGPILVFLSDVKHQHGPKRRQHHVIVVKVRLAASSWEVSLFSLPDEQLLFTFLPVSCQVSW